MQARNTLNAIQKAENFTNKFVIPGLAGTTEGVIEGLNTKLEVLEDSKRKILFAYFRVATKDQLSTPKGGLNHEQIRQISNGHPGQYQSNQPFAHVLAAEAARRRLRKSLH